MYSLYLLKEKGYGAWYKEKIKYYPQQMRFIWWTNLRSIMRIPVQLSDMVIISMVMPLEVIGIYKVYKEIASFIGRFGDPVNQAIYPEYAKLIGKGDSGAAINLAKKTILILFGLSSVLTVGLILFSNFIVGRLYGAEFLLLINALYILLGLFGVSLFTLPVNSLFIAAGFAKLGFYLVVFTNIIYLFTAFYFGKYFGIFGIITAFGIQMFLNQGLKIYILKKYRTGWGSTIR
jgi:O-antigen/teichoic acid export membrane protein